MDNFQFGIQRMLSVRLNKKKWYKNENVGENGSKLAHD